MFAVAALTETQDRNEIAVELGLKPVWRVRCAREYDAIDEGAQDLGGFRLDAFVIELCLEVCDLAAVDFAKIGVEAHDRRVGLTREHLFEFRLPFFECGHDPNQWDLFASGF